MAFTSHSDSAIDVCFENIIREGMYSTLFYLCETNNRTCSRSYRTVELDVDIGSSAFDYAAIQKSEVHCGLIVSLTLEIETC